MRFKSDNMLVLICSKPEMYGSFKGGTKNENVAMATS